MTNTPIPPKRRRRKNIAALALVLVSLCSWWFWPRQVDQRFVGRWERFYDDGKPWSERMWLRPKGVITFENRRGAGYSLTWGVHDDELVVGPQSKMEEILAGLIQPLYVRITGEGLAEKETRFKILSISADELQLQLGRTRFVYRRIPE